MLVSLPVLTGFNSTLVQLKGLMIEDGALVCSSFNSTLVQLKVYCINGYPKLPTSFNSTLVQLKDSYWIMMYDR